MAGWRDFPSSSWRTAELLITSKDHRPFERFKELKPKGSSQAEWLMQLLDHWENPAERQGELELWE